MPTKHSSLVGASAIHPAWYYQDTDPGAVGAGKLWCRWDGSAGAPTRLRIYQRDSANTGWIVIWDSVAPNGSVPLGGATGEFLSKLSGANYDFDWATVVQMIGPDAPPASANAMDDEFNAGSLDAKWSWRNQGSSAVAFDKSCAIMTVPDPGSGDYWALLEQTLPVGNWDFACRCWPAGDAMLTAAAAKVGLALVDSSSGKLMTVHMERGGTNYLGRVQRHTNVTTFSATVGTQFDSDDSPMFHGCYYRVRFDGTNLRFYFGGNGVAWTQLHAETPASFLTTPDRVAIAVASNGTHTQDMQGVFDWFRRLA